MAHADMDLDEALAVAHLPALLAALVHVTGDAGWLKPEWAPTYVPLSQGDPGLPQAVQQEIRDKAKVALGHYLANGRVSIASPDAPTLRRMMDFVAGAPIPEQYAPFLIDELAVSGASSKDPQF